MSNRRHLLTAIPVATLALALAACTPPEESPPMDPPADVETTPADDPWTQPEVDDPTAVDPADDPWDQPPMEDEPPTPIDPTMDPVDEQMPPPDPEEVVDPDDPVDQ